MHIYILYLYNMYYNTYIYTIYIYISCTIIHIYIYVMYLYTHIFIEATYISMTGKAVNDMLGWTWINSQTEMFCDGGFSQERKVMVTLHH